jgi:hypothetical protein
VRLDARHQGQAALRLEAGSEQNRFDLRSGRRDVLEPRFAVARAIGRDECPYVVGRSRAALVGDRVVEIRIVGLTSECGEKRADAFDVAAPRGLVTKRFLDPA